MGILEPSEASPSPLNGNVSKIQRLKAFACKKVESSIRISSKLGGKQQEDAADNPFDKLPTEILDHIFSFLLPSPVDPKLIFIGSPRRIRFLKKVSTRFKEDLERRIYHGLHTVCKRFYNELPSLDSLLQRGAIVPYAHYINTDVFFNKGCIPTGERYWRFEERLSLIVQKASYLRIELVNHVNKAGRLNYCREIGLAPWCFNSQQNHAALAHFIIWRLVKRNEVLTHFLRTGGPARKKIFQVSMDCWRDNIFKQLLRWVREEPSPNLTGFELVGKRRTDGQYEVLRQVVNTELRDFGIIRKMVCDRIGWSGPWTFDFEEFRLVLNLSGHLTRGAEEIKLNMESRPNGENNLMLEEILQDVCHKAHGDNSKRSLQERVKNMQGHRVWKRWSMLKYAGGEISLWVGKRRNASWSDI